MTRRFTRKYYVYLILWCVCVGLAALTGAPEPLVIGAPLFVALVAGLIPRRAPQVVTERSSGAAALFEGESVSSSFSMRANTDLPLVEAVYVLPSDAVLTDGTNTVVTSVPSGSERVFALTYRLKSRRVTNTGDLVIRITDSAGFTTWTQRLPATERRTVFPAPEVIRYGLRPANTRVFAGTYPSQITGEGIEFADVRQFEPGDRTSRINWSAMARTGEPYVNDFVTERNTDVVLLLDVFTNVGFPGATLLDYEARAAATVAEHYLRDKNRVGLVRFGHYLKYLLPAPGRRAWYRILSALSEMRPATGFVTHEIGQIPPRVLPPQALVIAFTGLVDSRFGDALVDLKARGFDVAVVHISPVALLVSGSGSRPQLDDAATRLWRLRAEDRVATLEDSGLGIVSWSAGEPFTEVMQKLRVVRHARRRVR
jgi:uncharacterized protein (DUF58 family)